MTLIAVAVPPPTEVPTSTRWPVLAVSFARNLWADSRDRRSSQVDVPAGGEIFSDGNATVVSVWVIDRKLPPLYLSGAPSRLLGRVLAPVPLPPSPRRNFANVCGQA